MIGTGRQATDVTRDEIQLQRVQRAGRGRRPAAVALAVVAYHFLREPKRLTRRQGAGLLVAVKFAAVEEQDLVVVAGPKRLSVGRRSSPHRMEGILGPQQ